MSSRPVHRIARFLRNHVWAILPEKLDLICEVIAARMQGIELTAAEIQARIGTEGGGRAPAIIDGVAVVPLRVVLAQRMNMFVDVSGGTSIECFVVQVKQLAAAPHVRAIVIDADSPGGTVDGMIEAAAALYDLRSKAGKPIVGVANPCVASAAYWLLAQCSEIVGSPSAQVGSIGVYCVHEDVSQANAAMGYKPTYVSAGRYKTEGNPDEPLGEDARAYLQQQIEARYTDFVMAVARGRGVSTQKVRTDYGQGRVLLAADALQAGLIDRIATLDETVSRLASGSVTVLRSSVTAARLVPLAAASLAQDNEMPEDRPQEGAPEEMPETMAPEDGECREGYQMGDDGMCHRMMPDREEAGQEARRRYADLTATALAVTETVEHV